MASQYLRHDDEYPRTDRHRVLREFERATDRVTLSSYEDTHRTGTRPRQDKELRRRDDTNHRTNARPGRLADGHKRSEHARGKIDNAVSFTIG